MPYKTKLIAYLPILLAFIACFLTDAQYQINGMPVHTKIAQDFSGWGILVLLVFHGIFIFFRQSKKKSHSNSMDLFVGVYLLGFTLFRAYHTLALFAEANANSLATALSAGATIREGLYLLFLSGLWLIYRGATGRYKQLSTPVA